MTVYKVIANGQIEYSTQDINAASRKTMQLADSGIKDVTWVTLQDLLKKAPAIFVIIPGTAGDKYVKCNKGEFIREIKAYGGVLEPEFHTAKDGSLFL